MEAGGARSGTEPLAGLKIVVTRPRAQAESLIVGLEKLGADVVAAPLIRIVDPVDPVPLQRAAIDVANFDWIVFTSANGVRQFWKFLRMNSGADHLPPEVSICAVGPSTAAALEAEGVRVDLIPAEFVAESVVQALTDAGITAGAKVLLPQADRARGVVGEGLREMGIEVAEVTAYRTVRDEEGIRVLQRLCESGDVDLITFTSGSTVRNFAECVSRDVGDVVLASIGPITSATMGEFGLRPAIESREHTAEGLLRAIESFFVRPEE